MKIDERIPNGIGYLEAMLWKVIHDPLQDPTENSFLLCFSDIELTSATPEQIAANLPDYIHSAVGISTTAANYEIVKVDDTGNFVSVATINTPITEGQNGNQRIRLLRNGNKTQVVYQDPGTSNVIIDDIRSVADNRELYPFVVFYTNKDYIKLAQVQCSISHFSGEVNTPSVALEKPVVSEAVRPYQSTYTPAKGWQSSSGWTHIPLYRPTNNSLVFQNITLARFLGYNTTQHPRAGTVRNINFSAPAQVAFGPRIAFDDRDWETRELLVGLYKGI